MLHEVAFVIANQAFVYEALRGLSFRFMEHPLDLRPEPANDEPSQRTLRRIRFAHAATRASIWAINWPPMNSVKTGGIASRDSSRVIHSTPMIFRLASALKSRP